MSLSIEQELNHHLASLPTAQQRQVLDFARALSAARVRGAKGSSLLSFAGTIPTDDLSQMQTAIDADCGRVDARAW